MEATDDCMYMYRGIFCARVASIDKKSCCQIVSISFKFRQSSQMCVYVKLRGKHDFEPTAIIVSTC